MPWSAAYGNDSAELRFYGDITGDEILTAKRELFAHPFERDPRYVLCDFTAVRAFGVSLADVKRIVEQDRKAAADNPGLCEVVVAPTPLEFGSSRMWEMLVDDVRPNTRVGKTRSEVLEWLEEKSVALTRDHLNELAASRERQA